MSKIYKGWEVMKAIADGKIKNGTKIISKDCSNNRIICFNFNELYWKDNGESVFNSIGLPDFLNDNFELIEYEVDINIDSIEELGISEKDNKVYSPIIIDNRIKINELIQAVKQLDKKVKELNTNEKS